MAAAMAFHPNQPKHISECENLDPPEQGILLEWLVAQELWRRSLLKNKTPTENLGFLLFSLSLSAFRASSLRISSMVVGMVTSRKSR